MKHRLKPAGRALLTPKTLRIWRRHGVVFYREVTVTAGNNNPWGKRDEKTPPYNTPISL
ncbi:MAG: hypothetical protein GX443_16530 [Deltaproteobacteria bacterium]|nr:hypothetical protein [Deltaproteobacteria bacterium]